MSSPKKSQFIDTKPREFGSKHDDGAPILNRYSTVLTDGFEYPGAQAMLYAAGIKTKEDMKKKPQIGEYTVQVCWVKLTRA